jgi:four helix bundle protein
MKNYKNLLVWQKAHAFVLAAYKASKSFPKEEQYNLTSQLRRAATSIPTNLAEGCGKFTQVDFARYLQISLGSTQEAEYLTFLAFELGYLSLDEFKSLDKKVNEVKAMLISLLLKVRKDDSTAKKKSR